MRSSRARWLDAILNNLLGEAVDKKLLSIDAEYLQQYVKFYESFVCGRINLKDAQEKLRVLNDEFQNQISPHILKRSIAHPSGLEYRRDGWMQSAIC